jgi:hypothetical protein
MKYLLQHNNEAERKDEWVTQRRIGVPSLTDNPHLRYTWLSAEDAEQQRPLYEAALKCQLKVVSDAPTCRLEEESEKFKAY